MALQTIEELDREIVAEESKGVVEAEKQVRITLAKTAKMPLELPWHPGKGGRLSVVKVQPGQSVVQPLGKSQVWLGPFSVPLAYQNAPDDREREKLRQFWGTEKDRILNRYDYPRGNGRGAHPDMTPVGPHRFPDVTVTILEADGSEHEPIRLHALYKIGEFDEAFPLDSFGPRETVADVRSKYEAELEEMRRKQEDDRRSFAEVTGMVKGLVAAKGKAD